MCEALGSRNEKENKKGKNWKIHGKIVGEADDDEFRAEGNLSLCDIVRFLAQSGISWHLSSSSVPRIQETQSSRDALL